MTEPNPLRARLSSRPPLRDRLLALRRSALARLAIANQLDSELLRLVADTGAALAVIDAEAAEAVPGDRALVVDYNLTVQIIAPALDSNSRPLGRTGCKLYRHVMLNRSSDRRCRGAWISGNIRRKRTDIPPRLLMPIAIGSKIPSRSCRWILHKRRLS